MKHLSKFWVKLLIAIIGGAIIDESIHAATGNSEINPVRMWIFIAIIYFLLAFIVWFSNWKNAKQEE